MTPNILRHFGQSNTAYLHPKGRQATKRLQELLDCQAGENVLEIGFGTAATLVFLASQYRETHFHGLESGQLMYDKGKRRIKLSLLKNIHLDFNPSQVKLPFADQTFDKVYAESVLAIQEGENLALLVGEIFRVLKPNGKFVCNDGIWASGFLPDDIAEMNRFCQSGFGIIQANADWPYIGDWEKLMEKTGFAVLSVIDLDNIPKEKTLPHFDLNSLLSETFTLCGKLTSKISSLHRKQAANYEAQMGLAAQHGKYLKGYLIECQKK